MRVYAFLLAVCLCTHQACAAPASLDLDNVDLDDEQLNVVNPDNLRKTEDIPVKVVEEPVLDENSNDYVPPEGTVFNVKRIEVDLENPGPPQRQEHETQNPESYSKSDKETVAIKHSIQQAQNVFNDGLKHVADSFKSFLQADEDLPLIQQNIKNLKETFTGQFEKLNETIRNYLQPESASSGESPVNPKLEIVQAHLKYLDNNFKVGVDTLTEGVEVYSIIKEEDEAEKAIALKADVKPESDGAPNVTPKPIEPQPAPWNNFFTQFQTSISTALQNIGASFSGGNNANEQSGTQPQQANFVVTFLQGIPNFFQGQNAGQKPPATQGEPSKPQNIQADPVPTPVTPTPAPWSPQAILQSVQNNLQNTWNNIVNPGQNNQAVQQDAPQPVNNNPFQQAYQNLVSFITPQTPQAQQPAVQPAANPAPAVAVAPVKAPEIAPATPEAADPIQGSNVVPAPVNDASIVNEPQAPPTQEANLAPAQTGPIQQLVQNNPIIKGIQSAVQRIQGTPNPETPREEMIQENQNKEETEDPKGHYHGGYRPDYHGTNQGDSGDSGRVEDKLVEKVQDIPTEQEDVLEEQIKAEELKTPSVSEKTE